MLQETIAYNRDRGNTVYVTLLDTKKAFDTVSYYGLFWKLLRSGCDPTIWEIMWRLYENFECSVYVHGVTSQPFSISQGVHQGAPMSMKMYTFVNNDLLESLQHIGSGIGQIFTSCPTYADDISLISLYKPVMQQMLQIAYVHSCKWRYQFHPQKSSLVVIGKDTSPNYQLHLGGHMIDSVRYAKHLGLPLVCDKKTMDDIIEKRISQARS